jgi:hypothetical protein
VLHRGLDGFYEVFPRQSVLFEFPNGEWLGFCATCIYENWIPNPDSEWKKDVIENGERDYELAAQIGAKNVWVVDE